VSEKIPECFRGSSTLVAQGCDCIPAGQAALAEDIAQRLSASDKMPALTEQTSNHLFEVLNDWEAELHDVSVDLKPLP